MDADGPLYEQIAGHVAGLVEAGALRPGGRVPSVRKLSRQFEVSTNTVLQALSTLEARGLVEARPRSGFYVRPRAAADIELPRTQARPAGSVRVAFGDRVPGLFRAMREVSMVPLAAACPSPALLPFARLSAAAVRVARVSGPMAITYDPLPGYPALRREIARRLVAAGCAISPAQVITTVGAVEALHLSLRAVTNPGDTVLVESPCYFGVLQLLSTLSLRAAEIPCDSSTGIRVGLVEKALRRRNVRACVVVANFSNPLGALMPVEEKRALVKLCRQHEVPLIESDVYGDLPFEGERPVPLKAFDRDGWVLHCSSFSKTLAPSYRVGWVCAGRFQARVEELKFTQTVATPTLPQAAIAEFLVSGSYDRHLRSLRGSLRNQILQLREAVARHFPPGTRVSAPAGGFLLWVELPETSIDALELQRRALRLGISIAPGPIFSASEGHRHCLRINGGYPWSDIIEGAIQTLGRLATARAARG
jgi:DNA-binding transcriptional MocR family regulator